MAPRWPKRVLLVHNEGYIRNDLRDTFQGHNVEPGGDFHFEVDTSVSIGDALEKVRGRGGDAGYDVIVLDLAFTRESPDRHGAPVAAALGVISRLCQATPVLIVFSGNGDLRTCVHVMRHGAWDLIDKYDRDGRDPYSLVVASAVERLKALDCQERLRATAVQWLQQHIVSLQERYGGKLVAIWNAPEMDVVASGRDVFELETALATWRSEHESWMYPFVISIPDMGAGAAARRI